MASSYHENREAQMDKKIQGMASFQHKNEPYAKHEPKQTENILKKEALHHQAVQLLAYKIHGEKGGGALDNWLEAEHILKNNYRT